MNRRNFLKTLGLATLVGCAPTLSFKHSKGKHIFKKADSLFVNTKPNEHYYVEASREEGLVQLRELAETSPLEESFYHVEDANNSYWLEVGIEETPHSVVDELFEVFFPKGTRPKITSYHIHPKLSLNRSLYSCDNSGSIIFSDNILSIPSGHDIIRYIELKNISTNIEFKSSCVITPQGMWIFASDRQLEEKLLIYGVRDLRKRLYQDIFNIFKKAAASACDV